MEDNDARTLWCGNLSSEVTEDLLYELLLQAGPLEKVCIPKNPNGLGNRNYGFVTFRHAVSVRYAVELMQGVSLFNRLLHVRCRTQNQNSSTTAMTMRGLGSTSVGRYGGGGSQPLGMSMMPHRGQLGMQSPMLSSSSSSRQCAELIELDTDSSSPSPSSRHNRPRAFQDHRRHRSFDDGVPSLPFRSPQQDEFVVPSPPKMDVQQHVWNQQPKCLQDPWKQLEHPADGGPRHQQQHHHQHHHHHPSPHRPHFERHNSWSPYGGHPYRRF